MRFSFAVSVCATLTALSASASVLGSAPLRERQLGPNDDLLLDNGPVNNGVVTPYKREYQQMKRSLDISQHTGDGMPAARGLGDGIIELFDREANDADDVLRRALADHHGL